MDINNLSLEEKMGQRFIFGANDENIECLINLIKNYYIGGVVLYRKNYHNYQDMINVIKRLKEANKDNKIPLFIAIDQEGGMVNRLPDEIHNLKNIYDVSRKNKELVYDYANVIGKILYNSGINMNLAPVIDIYNNSKSKTLYKRCFYGDSDNVTDCGLNYLKAINNNVISVIKHFPGHGITRKDSHFIIPFVFNYKEVVNKHIIPFNNLISNGIDALMVGHLIIRKITGLLPTSISNRFIDKYLRDYYNGLVITDEINMMRRWPIYRHIYFDKALKSHSDILLIKIKNDDDFDKIFSKYEELLKETDCSQLDNSVKRIIDIKKKYKINDKTNYDGIDMNEVNKTIDLINSKID